MIKRIDHQWTTIQCKNLVSDDGKLCNLCFKVLSDRFALIQQCPYCLGKIDLRSCIEKEAASTVLRKDWAEAPKRHRIREDG